MVHREEALRADGIIDAFEEREKIISQACKDLKKLKYRVFRNKGRDSILTCEDRKGTVQLVQVVIPRNKRWFLRMNYEQWYLDNVKEL